MDKFSSPFNRAVTFEEIISRAQRIDFGSTPTSMRAGFRQLQLGEHPAPDSRPLVSFGQVESRLSGAQQLKDYSGRVWVWFHGGGGVFGSPESHVRPTTYWAHKSQCPVLSPRYRLAPENPWPAALEDAVSVVKALQQAGHEVALAGDSAGGHLAISTALALAKQGQPVARLALFSPNTDRSGLNTTRAVRNQLDPIVDDAFDTMLGKMVFPNTPLSSPEVSLVRADLSLLPKTHVEVAGRELLRDDATIFFAFAKTQGAEVSLHETPEAFHMWQLWTPWLKQADESLARAIEILA